MHQSERLLRNFKYISYGVPARDSHRKKLQFSNFLISVQFVWMSGKNQSSKVAKFLLISDNANFTCERTIVYLPFTRIYSG